MFAAASKEGQLFIRLECMRRRRTTLYSILACAGIVLAACSPSGRSSSLWAFDGGVVSADGNSVELDVYGVPDSSCFEFDRVESEIVDRELVVSLYYLGPKEGQFCNIPCPLGSKRVSFPLDTAREPGTPVAVDPDTGQHCSQDLGSGGS